MTRRATNILFAVGAGALLLSAAAAKVPASLSQVRPGLWEVSGAPGAPGPARQCVAETAVLAQFEHRGRSCTRVVIRDQPAAAEIHYTCPGAGFGRTTLTVLTPRSLRIETQGISRRAPFHYTLQARRIGDCDIH